MAGFIDIVFDGPPSHESGRFVESEDENGHGINAGEWIDRGNGLWALRISRPSKDDLVLAHVLAERIRAAVIAPGFDLNGVLAITKEMDALTAILSEVSK